MSDAVPANIADDDPDRSLAERQLELLGELAELGLDVARAVAAKARDEGADVERVAMAYARVSRAVRLTVILQSKVIEARRDQQARAGKAMAEAAQVRAHAQARLEPGYVHKARVERIVERIAKAEHGDDEDEIGRLVTEAGERLDDEDVYGDVTGRPIRELVALICRDLDLDPDWTRLAEEAWAKEEDPARPPPQSGGGGPLKGVEGASPRERHDLDRVASWPSTGPP